MLRVIKTVKLGTFLQPDHHLFLPFSLFLPWFTARTGGREGKYFDIQ